MISSHRIGPAPFISVNECGAGELLILMHGIGGNKLNWITNIEVFGQYFKTWRGMQGGTARVMITQES